MAGPARDIGHIDGLIEADHDGLLERRAVVPMIKGGEPVLDAVGRGEEKQTTPFVPYFADFPDGVSGRPGL